MESTIKQPFTLNHYGERMSDIFGIDENEIPLYLSHKDLTEDKSFGIILIKIFQDNNVPTPIFSSLLSALIGIKFSMHSELVEYLVRSIQGKEDREDILETIQDYIIYKGLVDDN